MQMIIRVRSGLFCFVSLLFDLVWVFVASAPEDFLGKSLGQL